MPHAVLTGPIAIERERAVRRLFRELELSETHVNAVKLYNTDQPYHNHQHAFVVVLKSHEGALQDNLSLEQQRLLALAALYHDHLHTGRGGVADAVNVARAINGSREWLGMKEPWLTTEHMNTIAELIFATEASHRNPPHTTSQALLMDADILATDTEDREQWQAALGQELGSTVDTESTLTFVYSMGWHSAWGSAQKDLYIKKLQTALEARA
jgi:hypothetical protein